MNRVKRVVGKNILLVEDDQAVRESMKLLLEIDQHAVTEAGNGNDALRLFAGSSYDLVIMDYLMPEMLGDELAQRLKTLAPTLPILMVTGHARELANGGNPADAILEKPFTIKDLRQALPGQTRINAPQARGGGSFDNALPVSSLEDRTSTIDLRMDLDPGDAREHVDPGTLILWVQQEVETLDGGTLLPNQADPSNPGMMELLAFAYACNVLASDQIIADCGISPAFRFLCHGSPPFVSEVINFRRRYRPQLESVLAHTLSRVATRMMNRPSPYSCANLKGVARQRLDIARHLDTWS